MDVESLIEELEHLSHMASATSGNWPVPEHSQGLADGLNAAIVKIREHQLAGLRAKRKKVSKEIEKLKYILEKDDA